MRAAGTHRKESQTDKIIFCANGCSFLLDRDSGIAGPAFYRNYNCPKLHSPTFPCAPWETVCIRTVVSSTRTLEAYVDLSLFKPQEQEQRVIEVPLDLFTEFVRSTIRGTTVYTAANKLLRYLTDQKKD